MKFRTWLGVVHDSDDSHIFSRSGKFLVNRKSLEIGSCGYPVLRDNGKHDLYAEIQSYKDSCDLATILQSFDLSTMGGLQFDEIGDISDFTSAPKTPGELLNTVARGEVFFNELPNAVRSAFGHSLYNFVNSFGSDDFQTKLEAAYGIERSLAGSSEPSSDSGDSSFVVSGGVQSDIFGTPDLSNSSGVVSSSDTVVKGD